MKFTLIYDGDLASAGNKCKPIPASRIRNVFHDQLADLWDSHIVLRELARTAFTLPSGHPVSFGHVTPEQSDYRYDFQPPTSLVNLCGPIPVKDVGSFIPLIRHSLRLACSIDILFLRHEEPFSLMKNGGDLDGRIKTLFDALRMPDPKHEYVGEPTTADPLYVLLEDDALVSDFSVKSGRLLGDRTKKPHAVRLTIDVTVKVLRVFDANRCLTGD